MSKSTAYRWVMFAANPQPAACIDAIDALSAAALAMGQDTHGSPTKITVELENGAWRARAIFQNRAGEMTGYVLVAPRPGR